MRAIRYALYSCLVLSLPACTNEAVKLYQESTYGPPLEVPPDLTRPATDRALDVPQLPATAGSQKAAPVAASDKVAPDVPGIAVKHDGALTWLTIKGKPEQIWPWVRDFFLEAGFTLEIEDPSLGIVETGWKQQRTARPAGPDEVQVEDDLLKVYGVPWREKYRIRLERGADDSTEIYLTHRGARLLRDDDSIIWDLQPADPELEAEQRKRLLIYLGVAQAKAEGMLATALRTKLTSIVSDADGNKLLRVDQDFQRAWRRVGLALDHMKMVITDRDRANGIYYVESRDPLRHSGQEQGWFSKLFSGGEEVRVYQIVLRDEGESVNVLIRDAEQKLIKGDEAEPLLQQLSTLLE